VTRGEVEAVTRRDLDVRLAELEAERLAPVPRNPEPIVGRLLDEAIRVLAAAMGYPARERAT
jgi:hypothetical protein